MQHELGEVMLERDFETHDADGNVGQVKLRVGRPQLIPTGDREFWYCPHQIIGGASEHVRALRGMDALDALLMTLKLAHFELGSYARDSHKKITWLGDKHLGLPELEVSDEEHEGFAGFEEAFEEFFRKLGGGRKGEE